LSLAATACLAEEDFEFSMKEAEGIYEAITGRKNSKGTAYGERLYAFPSDEKGKLDLIFDGKYFTEKL